MTSRSVLGIALLAFASLALANDPTPAKVEPLDTEAVAKLRSEGLYRSKVMWTISQLCDVIGPRLTNSHGMKRANEWTRDTMMSWGLEKGRLEPWGPWGRGWQLDSFSMQITSPQAIPLIAYPKAWSPSIGKPVTTDLVHVKAETKADLDKLKGKLKGKIVMVGTEREVPAMFTPQGARFTDEQLKEMATPRAPGGQGGGQRGGGQGRGQQGGGASISPGERLKFFVDEGVVAVLDSARGRDGTLFVQSASVPSVRPPAPPTSPAAGATATAPAQPRPARTPSIWEVGAPKTVPQITVSVEHFNRLVRMIEAGEKLKVNLDLKASFQDKDLMAYNTVAEIPGTDKADEIVMAGGHLDSWHGATGATDNAVGCAVAMEAARLIKATGLKTRRTIRIALWSGEEQGLWGSRAYVAQHIGKMSEPDATGNRTFVPGPEYNKISAYFNLDNGTGRIRGVYQQGNEAVGPIFAEWLKPFADFGASTLTTRNTGSTDHVPFDQAGVPGFQFIQDPIEYSSRTHHSNQDTYERIQAEDVRQAAIILATFLYHAANRDELLPRKPKTS